MTEKNIFDTVIVGSGPAGLTAAIYNLRSDLKTLVISGEQPGGQLTITTIVENYPGFPRGIGGMKLMMDTQEQVRNLGGEIRIGKVEKIQRQNPSKSPLSKGDFEIFMENGDKLISKAIIVTTGAQAKWLGLPKEQELIGHGISGCATCDGMFFRDKVVAVVGGGDVAATDAEFLTKFASKLYLIHRRDELRAQVPQQKKILNNPKIEFLWNSEVKEINPPKSPFDKGDLDNNKLHSILIKNNKTGEEKVLELDGLFVAIGHTPATNFMEGLVELKDTGQIITGENKEYMTMTSEPGIFAAGDCVDDVYRQAIVAAGDGARAGLDAERWIGNQK